ncbi:uncharacterized protein BDR25DRAFT_353880 [Lindgomyces ingoldianus]|uniref:Uncharacterized protein n=1 Tax=Lindgomyces ingoldianus TaxID=673940 RepID=A0ACB6QZ05_9PLEO|nr:uncharacterized protein BDR25DRAFT_353880 [Lindgomyces ingoldianus]KAF2472156.1 hypothetical protein BDR25DRAFT_353880 [Lindgomyces ingoldianus]
MGSLDQVQLSLWREERETVKVIWTPSQDFIIELTMDSTEPRKYHQLTSISSRLHSSLRLGPSAIDKAHLIITTPVVWQKVHDGDDMVKAAINLLDIPVSLSFALSQALVALSSCMRGELPIQEWAHGCVVLPPRSRLPVVPPFSQKKNYGNFPSTFDFERESSNERPFTNLGTANEVVASVLRFVLRGTRAPPAFGRTKPPKMQGRQDKLSALLLVIPAINQTARGTFECRILNHNPCSTRMRLTGSLFNRKFCADTTKASRSLYSQRRADEYLSCKFELHIIGRYDGANGANAMYRLQNILLDRDIPIIIQAKTRRLTRTRIPRGIRRKYRRAFGHTIYRKSMNTKSQHYMKESSHSAAMLLVGQSRSDDLLVLARTLGQRTQFRTQPPRRPQARTSPTSGDLSPPMLEPPTLVFRQICCLIQASSLPCFSTEQLNYTSDLFRRLRPSRCEIRKSMESVCEKSHNKVSVNNPAFRHPLTLEPTLGFQNGPQLVHLPVIRHGLQNSIGISKVPDSGAASKGGVTLHPFTFLKATENDVYLPVMNIVQHLLSPRQQGKCFRAGGSGHNQSRRLTARMRKYAATGLGNYNRMSASISKSYSHLNHKTCSQFLDSSARWRGAVSLNPGLWVPRSVDRGYRPVYIGKFFHPLSVVGGQNLGPFFASNEGTQCLTISSPSQHCPCPPLIRWQKELRCPSASCLSRVTARMGHGFPPCCLFAPSRPKSLALKCPGGRPPLQVSCWHEMTRCFIGPTIIFQFKKSLNHQMRSTLAHQAPMSAFRRVKLRCGTGNSNSFDSTADSVVYAHREPQIDTQYQDAGQFQVLRPPRTLMGQGVLFVFDVIVHSSIVQLSSSRLTKDLIIYPKFKTCPSLSSKIQIGSNFNERRVVVLTSESPGFRVVRR